MYRSLCRRLFMNESSNDSMSLIGFGTNISQQTSTTYQVKDIVAREGNKTIKESI